MPDNLEPIPEPLGSGMTDAPANRQMPPTSSVSVQGTVPGSTPALVNQPLPSLPSAPAQQPQLAQPQAQAPPPMTPQQQAQAQFEQRQLAAAQATHQYHSKLGRAVSTLFGQQTSYLVDPASGQVVPTTTKAPPGQMFRSLLAGAILGGAQGTEGMSPGFGRSFFRAGAAGINRAQQQDQQRKQEAIDAQKRQQEKQKFDTEEDVRKAQIAHENALTAETVVRTAGSDLETHVKAAQFGKQMLSAYRDMGIRPAAEGVGESEMHQRLKDNPQAGVWDWEPVGVRITRDAKGNATHEYVFDAFDPKQAVPINDGILSAYRSVGLDKTDPEAYNALVAKKNSGGTMTPSELMVVKERAQRLYNDDFTRQKCNLS